MNRWEKEVQQSLLDSEEAVIEELERQYTRALNDINAKVRQFQADIDLLDEALSQDGLDDATKEMLQSQRRSKIYQQQYQQALNGQVSAIVDKLHGDNYATIDSYLKSCYETGYVGAMYSIAGQGIPIIAPIDQAAAVKAVLTDSKVVEGYYNHLGVNYSRLKKSITQEISRGIASSLPYRDIARNINNASQSGLNNAKRIARTEGHRIQQTSTRDAQLAAKAKGADVVKQWDAALDGRTRDSHRRVDGEIRELDEKFSNGLEFPGDPSGRPEEVINCRCTSDTRARWALDESELQTLQERAEYFGIDKTASFEEFKEKYLTASTLEQAGGIASPPSAYNGVFDDFRELNLSKEETTALSSLWTASKNTGHEYGVIIQNGVVGKPFTSGEANRIAINITGSGNGVTVLHSHTNATPPSATDFKWLIANEVDKIGVIGYNGDAYMAYVGDGEMPSLDVFDSVVTDIANTVNRDLIQDSNFFEWSIEERNYMAIREQAYRIAREFGWTLEGGRIDVS